MNNIFLCDNKNLKTNLAPALLRTASEFTKMIITQLIMVYFMQFLR